MAAKSNFCAIAKTAQTVGWTMDSEEDSGLPPYQADAKDPEGSFTLAADEGGGLDSVSAMTFSSGRHKCRLHLGGPADGGGGLRVPHQLVCHAK